MRRHRFAAYRYAPLERRLEMLGDGHPGANSLYVRDPDWVRARVASALRYSVQGRLV
jgi:hypothetical protein